jgi:hypothetical protein
MSEKGFGHTKKGRVCRKQVREKPSKVASYLTTLPGADVLFLGLSAFWHPTKLPPTHRKTFKIRQDVALFWSSLCQQSAISSSAQF